MKKKFGLIGEKLSHSFSKEYFTQKFLKLKLEASYENLELSDISQIKPILESNVFQGLNVTIPYKESILPYLDQLDVSAASVQAVNCVKLNQGESIGFNTDIFGFQQMIKPFLESHHEKALILGTGGASKAVEKVLTDLGIVVFYASRNPKNDREVKYYEINQTMLQLCGLIINTTPVGMYPDINDAPDIPYQFLNEGHLVVDLIYNPSETLFLKRAKEQGATVMNGETMLLQQAEKSWEIWNS